MQVGSHDRFDTVVEFDTEDVLQWEGVASWTSHTPGDGSAGDSVDCRCQLMTSFWTDVVHADGTMLVKGQVGGLGDPANLDRVGDRTGRRA